MRASVARGVMDGLRSDDIREWSVDDVLVALRSIGLEEYGLQFKKWLVDGTLLLMLSNEELLEIGVDSDMKRGILLEELADVQKRDTEDDESPPESITIATGFHMASAVLPP